MSILSGYKKYKRYLLTDSGYQLCSQWTSSNTVHFDDGKTAQIKLGAISGITDSLTATSSNIALSAKSGKSLQDQISELNTGLGAAMVRAQESPLWNVDGASFGVVSIPAPMDYVGSTYPWGGSTGDAAGKALISPLFAVTQNNIYSAFPSGYNLTQTFNGMTVGEYEVMSFQLIDERGNTHYALAYTGIAKTSSTVALVLTGASLHIPICRGNYYALLSVFEPKTGISPKGIKEPNGSVGLRYVVS